MSNFIVFLSAIIATYCAIELFIMATHSDRERRIFVILQIATGFGLSVWVIFDKSVISIPILMALVFIASDRLQTRIMKQKR